MATDVDQGFAPFDDHLPHFILLGLLFGTLLAKARYFTELLELALHDGSLTYTEGINGVLIQRPDLWFHPLQQAPHLPTIYPLGYHAPLHIITKILPIGVFQAMHVTALFSAVLTGGLITHWLLNRGVDDYIAILSGLLYALSPTVTGATVLGRVDHFGVLIGLAAAYTAVQYRGGDPWRAIPLTIFALYVKQSLIAFPIAIVVYYAVNHRRRDALVYALGTITGGLTLLAAFTITTQGRALEHLVFLNASQEMNVWLALALGAWAGFIHIGIATTSLSTLPYSSYRDYAAIFFLTALATGLLLAGKPGAWTGYYLPAIAAGCLLTGVGLDKYLSRWTGIRGLLVLLFFTAQFGLYAGWQPAPEYEPDAQNEVASYLETVEGPILSVDNGLLVRSGHRDYAHEPQLLTTLHPSARPPETRLVDDFKEQKYRVVVSRVYPLYPPRANRWSPDELVALAENYELSFISGGYLVLEPKEKDEETE